MQLKFEIENCKFLGKFVLISSFLTLFSIIFLFEAGNICFLLISVKFAAILRKIIFLEIQDGGQNGGHVVTRLLP